MKPKYFMFSCASTLDNVLIKSHSKCEFELRTRYLFMLFVKKALSVGLGDFFLESTGPNWTFTAQNHPLCEKQDRCSLFSVLCYFRYFVRE